MRAFMLQFIVATCVLLVAFSSQFALASSAIDWIVSAQNADGSYVHTTEIATATQSTAEALSTLSTLGEFSVTGFPQAVEFLNGETYLNTENLSRIIEANQRIDNDVSELLSDLALYQNVDGGFGELPGFDSTPLDTAFALIAMAVADFDDIDVVDAAIIYLTNHQQADGGFVLSDNNESSNYITALCSIALQKYRFVFDVSAELQAANEYLLAQQSQDTGWGTAWETAVALQSIVATTTDSTRYGGSAQALRDQQLANGSWANDVFVTALAARALHLVDSVKQAVAPTDGVITGKLVAEDPSTPLSSVQIRVDELPTVNVMTDANGDFKLENLPASTYTIRYHSVGYLPVSQTLSLQAGQTIDIGTVRLLPAADTAIISGTVADRVSGLSIAGATIVVTGSFAESTTTDTAGKYLLAGTPGKVSITVIATGYEPVVAVAEVTGSDIVTFSPMLFPAGVVNTDTLASINGSVVDAETGLAVTGARVEVPVTGQAAGTSASGEFTLQNLVSGDATVRITHGDYHTRQYRVVVPRGSAINLGAIRLSRKVTQPSMTMIRGTLTDADSGLALAGASVSVLGSSINELTDHNGQYRFEDLSGHQFSLVARAVGYLEATGTVSLTQPAVVDFDFRMRRASVPDLDIVDMHIETGITTYPALAEIEADAIVYNSGSTDRRVRMYYKVIDADDVIVAEGPVIAVPLGVDPSSVWLTVPAGRAIETEIEWYSGISPVGDYKIIAQAYDGPTGQLLAERAITVTIVPTNRIGGVAEFDPPIAQLAANSPVKVGATVSNTGNQHIAATTLTARVILEKQGYQQRKDLAQVDATLIDDSFDDTRGMTTDNNGNVYVANTRGNSVALIAADGSVATFADNLNNPVDIDIASNGDAYILNRNQTYVRIDAAGHRTETTTGLSDQTAIEALSDGRVLITRADALYAVLPNGSLKKVIAGGLAGSRDMVINSHGDVYIASSANNSIMRYSKGTLSSFVDGIDKPYGMAIDANDDLIVTSYGDNSLLRVTPDGVVSVIAAGLSGPFDVLIDNAGQFVVSNTMSNQIVSIDRSGNTRILADQTINKPTAAIYNRSGDLFVANSGFNNITRFSADGAVTEFATNLSEAVALLDSGDGGVETLQADGNIVQISAAGGKTTLANGIGSSKDFVHDPGGDGHFVLESSNRIMHAHADGAYSVHTEALLDRVRLMTVSASGDVYAIAGPISNLALIRIKPDKTATVVAKDMPFSRGMAVDASANVYLTDYNAREVLKIDASGGATILARTPFTPGAITTTANGEVLLAPFGGNTVYSLSPDSSLRAHAVLTQAIMHGLVEDSNGNLWVSDQNSGTVSRIHSANAIESFAVPMAGALQADGRGGVFVSGHGGILHIDATGGVSNTLSHDAIKSLSVSAFAHDLNGDFWIPDTNAIVYLFDEAAKLLQRFTALKQPSGMIVDADGSLVVTNGNNTVARVRRRGALPEVITSGGFNAIARESDTTALLSSGGAPRRLDLVTGSLSPVIPYRSTTLSSVQAVAVNPAGGFVLADKGHNRLHFYDAGDAEVDVQAGIVNPRGLTLEPDGTILAANAEPKGIIAVRKDRRAEAYLYDARGFDYLLTKPDGNIYAASISDGKIFEYDQRKRNINTLRAPESHALAMDGNGDLLSTMHSEGALIRVATDGSNRYQRLASGLSQAADVETSSAGDTHISDSNANAIYKLNADDSLSLDVAGVQGAHWLDFSPNGDMLVSYANNRLALFEDDGTRVELSLTNIIKPEVQVGGLTVDDSGTIYLSTRMQNALLKLQAQIVEPQIQTGHVVYRASAQLDSLSLDGQAHIDFGSWTPPRSGDYRVEISVDDGITDGLLINTLHVGAQADGSIVITDGTVQPGDQSISGVLTISGADPTQLTRIKTQNLTLAARTYALLGRGITADSLGNVYTSDLNKIVKVTPDGIVSDFVTGINEGISMAGMVTDKTDTIYTPSLTGLLLKFTHDGHKSSIGSFPSRVEAVALDNHDRLYAVTSAGRLYRVDKSSGSATELPAEGLLTPRGMTIDAYGNIYVLNKNTSGPGSDPIIRISPGGDSTNFFDNANFEFEGIPLAADCSSNLLFAPIKLPPFKYVGEEDIIVQLIGETGQVHQVLHGPTIAKGLGDIDVIYYDRFANRLLFYTDWNDGEIFSFPIICGGIAVEAHLVTHADVDLSSTDPAPNRIIDRDDGVREFIWQLDDVDTQGHDIQLNLLLRDLAEGEHRPILSQAYLVFSNSFDKDARVKVAMDIPEVFASSQISMETRVDALLYGADSLVDIVVDVSNDSTVIFDGSIDLRIVDASGITVETLPAITIDELPPQSLRKLTSVWSTGVTLTGDYAVVATLKDTKGKILKSSEAAYHLQAGSSTSPVITASVRTNKSRFSAWDTVAIS